MAAAGALYQMYLASEPINDHFMHVAWGRELLKGNLPVRDFFEAGEPLSELLTAGSERLVGYRLLSEALVIGMAVAVTVWLVFRVTCALTRAATPGVFAAALVILAGTRSYSYPKPLIYAVMAALVFAYVHRPSRATLMGLGCWTGLAFLWRHDHGVYLALGTTLTILVVHRFTRTAFNRLIAAGALAILFAGPYLAWVEYQRGLRPYITDGIEVVGSEFSDHAPAFLPAWPLRHATDLIGFQPQEKFGPIVDIVWTESSTRAEREAAIERLSLITTEGPGPDRIRARLGDPSTANIRALLNHPAIADTAGIDRTMSAIRSRTWGFIDRVRFRHELLRVRPTPVFDDPERAAQAMAWSFIVLAVGTLGWAAWPRWSQPSTDRPQRLALELMATLFIASMPGLLRAPLDVYAPDVVALPAIMAGWATWAFWRRAARSVPPVRTLVRVGVGAFVLLLVLAVSSVGTFAHRFDMMTDAGAIGRAWTRLATTPPVAVFDGEPNDPIGIIARYVRTCTAPDASLLVLGFAPDLQYYSDRQLASRHLLLGQGRWTSAQDQNASLDRLRRSAPPIVIAERPFYDRSFPRLYSILDAYVRSEYQVQSELSDRKGHSYLVLTRTALAPLGTDEEQGWPCFTSGGTIGHPKKK